MLPLTRCPRSWMSCLGEGKHPAIFFQVALLISSHLWAVVFTAEPGAAGATSFPLHCLPSASGWRRAQGQGCGSSSC